MNAKMYYQYQYFKTPDPWAEKYLLVSDGMGYTAESDFCIDRKSFYNYLAFFIHRGTFYVEQYGKKMIYRQGEVGVLSLMDAHRYYSDPEDVTHLLWFHFRGSGIRDLMEHLIRNHAVPFQSSLPELEDSFLELFQLTSAGCHETELSSHIYGLLMKIFREYSPDLSKEENLPREMKEILSYMEENLCAGVSLEQLCTHIHMGQSHFSHMFKRYFGISPMQYYKSRRMEHACLLLREHPGSVDEISALLGYLDSGYFRKSFKNFFGITPAAYRRMINGQNFY